MSVANSWSAITDWLEEHLPGALEHLRPPATEQQIADCEVALGVSFPQSLKDLYLLHDGQEEDEPFALAGYHQLLPLEDLIGQNEMMRNMADGADDKTFADWRADIEDGMVAISGPVKAYSHSPQWIQFTETPVWHDVDARRCIDLDPAPGGVVGQVIEINDSEDHFKVLANSLEEFLETYAAELGAGRFVVKEDLIADTDNVDPGSWGVPEYLMVPKLGDGSTHEPRTSPRVSDLGEDDVVELPGKISMLFGSHADSGESAIFVFTHIDGRKYVIFASNSGTEGYDRIFTGDVTCVRAQRYADQGASCDEQEPPELAALSVLCK